MTRQMNDYTARNAPTAEALAKMVAEHMAKKGITKVPAGHGTLGHLTRHDWANKVRGEPTTDELIAQRRVIIGADGVEHVQNGLGEWIA